MAKIKEYKSGVYIFFCPGCEERHVFYDDKAPENRKPRWKFNGDLNNPTVNPSLLYRTGHYVQGQPQPPNCRHCNDGYVACVICHSFVENGQIRFLNDCTHELAGQTVPLPKWGE